jgi:hypothetical protein
MMSALFIARGAQANAAHGALFHVVVVGLMRLDVCAEWDGSMLAGIDMLSSHDVPGGVLASDPIIGRKGVEPEDGVFYKMD